MTSLKRSISNASNKADLPNKRIQIAPYETSNKYVYMVIQEWQPDSYAEIETKHKGAYCNLIDANNRVLQLWNYPEDTELGPEERKETAMEGALADGTLWWRDSGDEFEGEMIYVRIEKHELIKDTGAETNTWRDNKPSQNSKSGHGHPYSYYE